MTEITRKEFASLADWLYYQFESGTVKVVHKKQDDMPKWKSQARSMLRSAGITVSRKRN